MSLQDAMVAPRRTDVDVVALDDALQTLARIDLRQSRVVELRFFAGFSLAETSEALEIAPATVQRDWTTARAWLHREICNLLKARVVICSYNDHLRLLSPSLLVGLHHQSLLGRGNRHCLWNHYAQIPSMSEMPLSPWALRREVSSMFGRLEAALRASTLFHFRPKAHILKSCGSPLTIVAGEPIDDATYPRCKDAAVRA